MRNFFNGDGENRFEFDHEDEEGQKDVEINIETDLLGAMELDLVEFDLNQQLLDRAMNIAKQDVLWWFRSPVSKVRLIEKIYRRLERLMSIE